ncbi:MAG: hypothetical protein A2418_02620 [Candidatus Brennerbacteria bacterium RIFOXYC1_FULL_41_11]|uniref:Uncharacterized protein n=1 Tax=Candidatus Brennerbacteria bacterium RIFOXYD1_FULL_41_16 TaxID=1797529 RepID=A0A1G1XLN9_9BACT|nr:MAG: hypothetical protein A2391_02375 [Candidatus Brennerbacteria bacterium RIFOXYB1_FULL_41_13]OGY39074.1 MAG: hypothetical protein A2418_02620 [Candidatus Brennerbacteria bacterium RIFOXYC1_FULL_41_11]OGY40227.1 MAG: hypothetical protein A2570_03000 [Candidatus Brennerbacteria bacterium RIFOXYD1_FULL_41_16]
MIKSDLLQFFVFVAHFFYFLFNRICGCFVFLVLGTPTGLVPERSRRAVEAREQATTYRWSKLTSPVKRGEAGRKIKHPQPRVSEGIWSQLKFSSENFAAIPPRDLTCHTQVKYHSGLQIP